MHIFLCGLAVTAAKLNFIAGADYVAYSDTLAFGVYTDQIAYQVICSVRVFNGQAGKNIPRGPFQVARKYFAYVVVENVERRASVNIVDDIFIAISDGAYFGYRCATLAQRCGNGNLVVEYNAG